MYLDGGWQNDSVLDSKVTELMFITTHSIISWYPQASWLGIFGTNIRLA
jgi:hypothetical protein